MRGKPVKKKIMWQGNMANVATDVENEVLGEPRRLEKRGREQNSTENGVVGGEPNKISTQGGKQRERKYYSGEPGMRSAAMASIEEIQRWKRLGWGIGPTKKHKKTFGKYKRKSTASS